MTIIMGASIFQILNFTFNGLLSAQGNTKPFRNFLIVGFFLNLFLDPLFIFGWFGLPQLGAAGVALATVVVQALGTLYLGWSFFRSSLYDRSIFANVKINRTTMLALLKQGLPVSLSNATIAIGIFVIQFFIYRYGNDQTLAGYGVAVRIEQIALLPTIGLNIATLAIAGQNYGAQLYKRIEQTYRQAIKYAVILLAIGLLILYPFAPQLVAFFNRDPDVIQEGVGYLRIEGLAIFSYSIIGISTSILQAIKKPYLGLLIGVLRQLSPIVVFFILGDLLNLGMNGVWWGIVIVNYLAMVLSWSLVSKLLKPLLKTTL
jgi:Na+-driven multidrug efflux pump